MRARWVVARLHVNQESRAVENVERQGFLPFCPKFARRVIKRHRLITEICSLFPNYLLVNVGERSWAPLNSTKGIKQVICNGDPVHPRVIARLMQEQGEQGYIPLPSSRFRQGDKVRPTRGAFLYQIGIYQDQRSHERCNVLFKLMGMEVPASIDEALLEAA